MGIKVALEHRTSYTFDRLTTVHPHVVRLRPAPHSRTPIEAYSLTVTPADHFINWQQDAFGNYLARLVFPERTNELTITVGLVADLKVINPFDFFIEEYAENYGFSYPPALLADLEPYLRQVDETEPGSGPGPTVKAWLERFEIGENIRIVDFLVKINAAVQYDVGYSVRMEPGVQTPDHTLNTAIGSCRDSAWLLVSLLRELGLAARFVSGYLVQLTSDIASLDGPSGPGEDFTDLHAWTEVYIPGAGWIGMDPTSGLFAGEGHIPLSATPHPSSSAPISGATDFAGVTFDFSNTVTRVHEDPRVTLPYSEQQWEQILTLGDEVDARLADRDVRLTMGGEPTFVSIDDFTAAEWTIDADGPQKRERAGVLAERLRKLYAVGGIVHRGQGKWYPGEPLPRWQIGLHWRADGVPLWPHGDLLADPWSDEETPDAPAGSAQALATAVATRFGLPESQVRPAFEDALARITQQSRLPEGPPPGAGEDLVDDTVDARTALIAALDATVTEPTAFVLPLGRFPREDETEDRWISPNWRLRRGRILLTPGDSPAGLRLPLDAVSWVPPEPEVDPDPLVTKAPLAPTLHGTAEIIDAEGAPTTALVVEIREGRLYVFLPPMVDVDSFVELIARLESAVAEVGVPVILEGYGPPGDPRLQSLSVTPDPGVIEVNVQPTKTWREQVELTETLYEEARQSRLGTETFDLDGSHTGTGGGNHLTLGGTTPADSPLLRRPDLLVSLLTYWQRHPSLSYLFSGTFIGPTSQAPRFDEGRPDMVYELEIAFAEIARITAEDGTAPPWVVDRALRHILTDLTGNTHRAEFCIDKLYSPDSARGRLGLLELRGFEMPPHSRMASVQALLVRSLVARFWDEPLQAPLVRHGENLHGRYLLPYFVISDIAAVAEDLRRTGIDFATSWFDPFTEFRFPRLGTAVAGGVQLELRGAIEPWHVLGEEATGGGTSRYVDSSTERVQILTDGLDAGRHVVTCNGVPVPLLATDVPGRRVAGVRYRAWQPPSALHPTIEVQSPLRFDVVDLQSGVSLGGATYHVTHPGGLSYDAPPLNALEAESRRGSRFEQLGHTAGEIDLARLRELIARQAIDPTPSGLLDLRRSTTVLR